MARRLPDRPPNGIGFAIKPRLVPKKINTLNSISVLSKPFKIPYKINKPSNNNNNIKNNDNSIYSNRLRKRAHTVSYKDLDVNVDKLQDTIYNDSEDNNDDYNFGLNKRKDALSSTRLMNDPNRLNDINTTLKRSFTVPIKGYIPRHNLTLTLGTKKKIVLEPRPLHDPTDEFAIVLYDPSIDGEMILHDNNSNRKTDNEIKDSTSQENKEIIKENVKPHFTHPKFLSNGLKNKSLSELLNSTSTNDDFNKKLKKFPNVPVVIDPRLSKILRPHQIEGVKFLYRCVTGLVMKDYLESERLNSLQDKSTASQIDTTNTSIDNATSTQENSDKKSQESQTSSNIESKETHLKGAYGCIMADEMGLGKTLQCIALMWTLLKQGPQGQRLIDKCIIVCPSSLVNNWANELIKWLGPGTLTPLAIDGKKSSLQQGNANVAEAIHQWAMAKGNKIVKPVLIISYETLRRNVKELENCHIGLLLADEGHRLKNGESLTFTALNGIDCPRRVILSGTPIQNDLSEYFALLSFSNPGLLGTRLEFRKNYEIPILRSRDMDATDKEIKKGDQQLSKLSNIVSKFIIRRTNDILSKYLPCKYEHVIFINLKPWQNHIYKKLLKSRLMKNLIKQSDSGSTGGSQPLRAIGILKKLCNHPNLIDLEKEFGDNFDPDELNIPSDFKNSGSRDVQTKYSGKFSVLERFLRKIKTESDDKIVLISNYTQTLDLIERMCRYNHYNCVRLDGTMTINKRQKLVDRFNDPEGQEFIFLLSSKAGGCGINLIGANRLILLDPDWNPAADQQALARVWRDGQKKDCFIYRFITTGAIEEKIYQRQSMKMSLSSCVVDAKEDVERLFSADNLRQLFELNEKTNCDTHETFNCKRCSKEGKQKIRSRTMLYGDATTWNHLDHEALRKTNDHLLQNEFQYPDISYAFQYISH